MQTLCAKSWRRRLSVSRLQTAVGFSDEQLVLGCGTVLVTPDVDGKRVCLRRDAAHDRMVALLAVAGRGRLAKAALQQLDVALDEWRRGDRTLAAIRLAFVRLPRVRDLDEAHTLFLAETALDAGLSPNDLLRELGHATCLPLLKDWRTQPRVPAGCGRPSGQWTCDASGISFVPNGGPAAFKPVADADGTLKPTPVFLRPQDEDADTHDIEDKQRRSGFEAFDANQIEEGRALLFRFPDRPVRRDRASSMTILSCLPRLSRFRASFRFCPAPMRPGWAKPTPGCRSPLSSLLRLRHRSRRSAVADRWPTIPRAKARVRHARRSKPIDPAERASTQMFLSGS